MQVKNIQGDLDSGKLYSIHLIQTYNNWNPSSETLFNDMSKEEPPIMNTRCTMLSKAKVLSSRS